MLKFSVQKFYQPLFSHAFPFSNFLSAILFPLVILFPSKSFPDQKAESKNRKPKPKKTEDKKQKLQALLQQAFYKQWQTGWSRGSQGGAIHLTG
jgi:hypothetical protein